MEKGYEAGLTLKKMYWKLVFVSCFMHFYGVKLLVYDYTCVNCVTFRNSAHSTTYSPNPLIYLNCRDLIFPYSP